MPAFLFTHGVRVEVLSLHPHFARSIEAGHLMDPSRMRPEDVSQCPWIGWGMSKGVTHPDRDLSILAHKDSLDRGLHAELVAEFTDEVDPYPLCYDEKNHQKGFGGFTRWVAFTDPQNPKGPGVLGIDWSLACRPTSGVATSMWQIMRVVQTALPHGLHPQSEIALLDWRMSEDEFVKAWRYETRLVTAEDWVSRASTLFVPMGHHCLRCGMKTFERKNKFCFRCGTPSQNLKP